MSGEKLVTVCATLVTLVTILKKRGVNSMVLQIYQNDSLVKDVLCLKHEYDQWIASLNLSRIPFKVMSDSIKDGLQHIILKVEDASFVSKYFY